MNNYLHRIILLYVATISVSLFAHTITGLVVDPRDKKLSGVKITLVSDDGSPDAVAYTNSNAKNNIP